MRMAILELLRASADHYLSGEEIALKLNVSRTAVWKHIKELKNQGYEIESLPRNGYKLLGSPDRLLPELVCRGLDNKVIGCQMEHFDDIGSTNAEAKVFARQGAADGTVIVSESQNTGRGRLDRSFFCPQGGIWFSVILRPDFLPQEAPKCTLMAAVAVTEAMRDFGLDAGIKWPNDILYQGKKLTGILTEMSAEIDRINYVIIGIGINAVIAPESFPEDIKDKAGSMSMFLGKFDRISFFRAVLQHLETLYISVKKQGFGSVLKSWRDLSVTLGQDVKVIGINETFTGRAVDIAEDGGLMVDTGRETCKVYAGDVSIRTK
ncbi:MAG: biotin--[acetyl-CoA-carboxylase] ligase [Anaerovibrio sp.]|uniref:biotin--[acetyl-CoA-carboxylase] ligase n=1 Tax=Anaerovibrio sp. TaxID=1872532 RepID=UPI0025F8EF56|nr:biotin--[acetyl-CoA-carboxylase] ligase [Anaerovibrio sp.]MCR5176595.1 biotin--[acetyl-CoA-carboxylase] ligase [Anaerovibrio sp.]